MIGVPVQDEYGVRVHSDRRKTAPLSGRYGLPDVILSENHCTAASD